MLAIIRFFSGWKLTTCGNCRGWRPGGCVKVLGEMGMMPSAAKARYVSNAPTYGLKPVPFQEQAFSATRVGHKGVSGR